MHTGKKTKRSDLKYLIAGSNLFVQTCNVLTLFDICTSVRK